MLEIVELEDELESLRLELFELQKALQQQCRLIEKALKGINDLFI